MSADLNAMIPPNAELYHIEMLMANAVAEEAAITAGKEARAMESFANALRNMPAIIAENGGYDSAQLVSELRALHKQGNKTAGLGKHKKKYRSKKLILLYISHFILQIFPIFYFQICTKDA